MAKSSDYPPVAPASDWPLYWFAELERAVDQNEWAAAETARQELERLGVTVTYRLRPGDREEAAHV